MLTLTDISYTYPARGKKAAVPALGGVSLSAEAGAVTAVVGPNGSGKSTLFRLVTGTLVLQQGSVLADGSPIRNARVGVVFQSPALDDQLTVFENFSCHAALYGMRLRREELPADLIAVLDLQNKLDDRVATLSGGFQRRVELAKALLTDPTVLILDEPFTGLDVNVRDSFFATLHGITAQRGLTTLLITHELGLAGLCDRVVLLETGSVIADAPPAELLAGFGRSVVEITTTNVPDMEKRFVSAGEKHTLRLPRHALLIKDATMQEVLQTIDEQDESIRDMLMRRPSLEDYFIARTGHGVLDGKEELLEA